MTVRRRTQVVRDLSGNEWAFDMETGSVEGRYLSVGNQVTVRRPFRYMPHSESVLTYIAQRIPSLASASVAHLVMSLYSFCAYLTRSNVQRFTAAAYAGWLRYLRDELGWRESSRRCTTLMVRLWLEDGLVASDPTCRGDVDAARARFRKHFRGFSKRAWLESQAKALSAEEFHRLIRAVRLELEEWRTRLAGEDGGTTARPRLSAAPFIFLAGLLMAVRSAEFNRLNIGDLREIDSSWWLRLCAPNKASALMPMPEVVQEALRVARAAGPQVPNTDADDAPLLVVVRSDGSVGRFYSTMMQGTLRAFAVKWFRRRDKDGQPVLFRTIEGKQVPLRLAVSELRSAGISEWARRERNPEKLRIFARHRRVTTTRRYYVRQAHEDFVAEYAGAMRNDAELLRATMRGAVATREEVELAKAAGAFVRGGHCGEVLEAPTVKEFGGEERGDTDVTGCDLAEDCRLCWRFRIHPERRHVFLEDRDNALAAAGRARTELLKREAEMYEGMAALNQAVLDRIDEHYAAAEDEEWL